jgi:signal transduction histidine kinase/ligand-binding sensor domain-containing protein
MLARGEGDGVVLAGTLVKHIGLVLIGLLFCECAWSLGLDLTLPQLNHKSWTVSEGSPRGVSALAQTTDGTLWVGGTTGLARFDGIRFVHYPQPSDEPLQATDVSALTASPDGGLWIGFRFGGVSFLHEGRLTRYGEREGLPAGTVQGFVWDHDGTLWAAMQGGLARLARGRWQRVASESIPIALGALVDRDGTLWVATIGRVLARAAREDHFREMAHWGDMGNDYPDNMPFAMSSDGRVWTWTNDGLTRMDSPTDRQPSGHRTLGWAGHFPAPLLFDRENNLWLGGGAVRRLASRELFSSSPRLPIQNFTDESNGGGIVLFEDREGNIWVGTEKGLCRFSHSNIIRAPLPPCSWQYVFAAGGPGTLWAACSPNFPSTVGFVLEIRNGTIVHQQDTAAFTAGFGDLDGSAWFGGDAGLGHTESGRLVVTPWPEELHTDVQAVARDRTGALWISLIHEGVLRLAHGQWVAYGGLQALPRLTPIVETVDAEGALWLGYTGNRIARVNGREVQLFDASRGLDVGNVTAIHASKGRIWVGGDLGFARFDGVRFTPILGSSGNAFTGISGIIETQAGELWLNGIAGITHISRPEVERVSGAATHRVHVETFDYVDGVPGTAQQMRPIPTALETTDGRLWFATTDGLVLIDPSRVARNAAPPPATVWSIRSGGVRYPVGNTDLSLPIHTTQLQIDYTAGSLTVPERVGLRYRLEGSDRDWQDAGQRREAYYTNLRPGRYTFRVVASNSEGVWNTSDASVRFTIRPAFYQTTWFYALCALLCVALLAVLYRVRMQQISAHVRGRLEERLAERERIARELHDTLLQGMHGLILRFQAATDRIPGCEPARGLMERALERADELLDESRARVKDLRAPTASGVELPHALEAAGEQLALAHPVGFRASTQGRARELHPIVREEVLLIGREGLVNAFRHANASQIEVEVFYGETELRMRVWDNGGGIDQALLHGGQRVGHWGLLGMRERANKLSAHLDICSTQGGGTFIDLRVPAAVAYRQSARAQSRTWWRRSKHALSAELQ